MIKVLIVIPVKNSAELLEKCLASVRGLDFPADALEVVIVDGGSTDGSVEVAESFGCKIIAKNEGIISYAKDFDV